MTRLPKAAPSVLEQHASFGHLLLPNDQEDSQEGKKQLWAPIPQGILFRLTRINESTSLHETRSVPTIICSSLFSLGNGYLCLICDVRSTRAGDRT